MENKKSFGEYLRTKRKDAELTQREFADKLFVTESAVSKWERGLSYPDVTLIRDICEVLGVSEHELLTSSEDVEARNQERLAKKYMTLIRRLKGTQFVLYSLALLTCFICNLVIQHRLSWFFIVLTAELTAASLTLLPVLVTKQRARITLGGFTLSLILLLLTCAVYTGGDWFIVAVVSLLFGVAVAFLPFVLRGVWAPEPIGSHKALFYFAVDTVLLFLLLLTCAIYTGGDWFLMAVVSILFGMAVIFLPFVFRDPSVPEPIKSHKALFCFAADTVLLFALLLVSVIYTQGDWFFSIACPIAGFCLILPWAMMLIIRYIPMSGLFKTAACLAVANAFLYYFEGVLDRILGEEITPFGFSYNFRDWSFDMINGNVRAIIFFSLLGLTILFALAGVAFQLRSIHRGQAV